MEEYKLTQFSPGAGCGCKISPKDLEAILKSEFQTIEDTNLLVGNASKDDAAVYQIDENNAIISTTDFFTPIVDNPFDFGRIAATNAISDIYAMGGKPIMAIAILGWPLVKLPKETAQIVINGARHICREAGISISGGHSIDISDPIFGLAVTGQIHPANIKQNNMAKAGCSLFLTKALGVGIITTAEKRGIVKNEHIAHAIKLMTTLNKVGYEYSKIPGVTAMTDITGFGLLGHLIEMCEGSNLHAVIEFDKLPLIDGIKEYIKQKAIPGGTFRNWKSYSEKIGMISEEQKMILCDPQTSGGLLVAVEDNSLTEFMEISSKNNSDVTKIGVLKQASEKQQIIIIQ
ncbi:MAG: selenide, water dikinase SelD [Bacteroidota bacterium]